MRGTLRVLISLLVVLLLTPARPADADEGSGRFKIGYIYIDEEGHLGVNQESFNLDDPVLISLENVRYLMDNGLNLSADLRNVSLENRNLRASASRANLFSLSLHDNQYRRTYDSAGHLFTERETYGGRLTVSPSRHLKLFGGYDRIDKEGDNLFYFQQPADLAIMSSDYEYDTFNIGAQGFYRKANARVEFRDASVKDKLDSFGDRESNTFHASAASPVPKFERIVLSGGYDYRIDKVTATPTELETNQGWAATRIYLPMQFSLDYRFVFARTLHRHDGLETDNALNTVTAGKIWGRRAGLRVGYENRIADDLIDRSESHALLVNGWYNHASRVFLRALLTTRAKDIETGATLLGEEEYARYRVSARVNGGQYGNLSVQYQGRHRENEDIGTSVDYSSFATTWSIDLERLGALAVTYAYYLGEYENRSAFFEFSDNTVSATITPVTYRGLGVNAGGTYYRSRRNVDIEKFSLDLGTRYQLQNGYILGAKYTAYNYDDYLDIDRFYTGNFLEVSLAKDFAF